MDIYVYFSPLGSSDVSKLLRHTHTAAAAAPHDDDEKSSQFYLLLKNDSLAKKKILFWFYKKKIELFIRSINIGQTMGPWKMCRRSVRIF